MESKTSTKLNIGGFLLGCGFMLAIGLVLYSIWISIFACNEPKLFLAKDRTFETVADESSISVAGDEITVAGENSGTESVQVWRETFFNPVARISIIALILMLVAHFLIWGPKKYNPEGGRTINRFTVFETATHYVVMSSFVLLAITGMSVILGSGFNISNSFGGVYFLIFHYIGAVFFTAGLVVLAVYFWQRCFFEKYDLEWIKHAGGYLGYKEKLPAGCFNAGQKAFFWGAVAMGVVMVVTGLIKLFPVFEHEVMQDVFMTHDLVALFLVLMVMIHFYMGIIVNPGCWQAMFCGVVKDKWAEKFHPCWDYRTVPGKNNKKGTKNIDDDVFGEVLGRNYGR